MSDVDCALASDDDQRRLAVRAWLAAHLSPTGRQLAEAASVVPHWPAPCGLEADPVHRVIIDEELRAAEVTRPASPVGIGWVTPTIFMAGTDAQRLRCLSPALACEDEELWCQLFSEPDPGSDLAPLQMRAARDGDEWVVDGSKIWASGGHLARFGILLARTDPETAKRKGISYFVCPIDTPGITMTPIVDMTGAHSFNQVFFDEARLPADCLVGGVNGQLLADRHGRRVMEMAKALLGASGMLSGNAQRLRNAQRVGAAWEASSRQPGRGHRDPLL